VAKPVNIPMRERALRLRLSGLTFAEVGLKTGVSKQMVIKLLQPKNRKEVFKKAKGKCSRCGIKLNSHTAHYHSTPTGSWDNFKEPMVLLCISCHREIHNQVIGHG